MVCQLKKDDNVFDNSNQTIQLFVAENGLMERFVSLTKRTRLVLQICDSRILEKTNKAFVIVTHI